VRLHKEKRVAVYVRCSTEAQATDAQEAELREYAKRRGWTVQKVYADRGVSGANANRPALDELMADCRRGRCDRVLVWKFDRFARSVSDLLHSLEIFNSLGIEFISLTEQVDSTTASGRMVLTVLGAVAELEHSLIRERVRAGLAHARKQGKRLGRPPLRQLSEQEEEHLRKEVATSKQSLRKLATKYRVSLWKVHTLSTELRRGV